MAVNHNRGNLGGKEMMEAMIEIVHGRGVGTATKAVLTNMFFFLHEKVRGISMITLPYTV